MPPEILNYFLAVVFNGLAAMFGRSVAELAWVYYMKKKLGIILDSIRNLSNCSCVLLNWPRPVGCLRIINNSSLATASSSFSIEPRPFTSCSSEGLRTMQPLFPAFPQSCEAK